eukprot:NODE_4045_length_872_cov_29.188335_g3731_i0.p1 GENE.NODE_4045_length_872_cov_29.188335_g3731_i0~~NODE_4045_length_872_cov_29.188335_g3731_i0.p1  ORF type:complete len:170 (+),score=34.68 NODE_4045_length_872_cov_29.188335_g3731_i0:150-659(+)
MLSARICIGRMPRALSQQVRGNAYLEVPIGMEDPKYRPVINDPTMPFFGAPGVHYNPTKLPIGYDLYWGTGHKEILIFDIHDSGRQESVWISIRRVLQFMGALFLFWQLVSATDNTAMWFNPTRLGHTIYPNHANYLLHGGDPKDPLYLQQLAKEEAITEEGKRLAVAK